MWRKQSQTVRPAVPAFGRPKPPPAIPFKKQQDAVPKPAPEQPEPAIVQDRAPVDRGAADSYQADPEVLNWIKITPILHKNCTIFYSNKSFFKALCNGARTPCAHPGSSTS